MSLRLMPISSMPWPEKTSSMGIDLLLRLELDEPVVELAGAQLGAELLPGGVAGGVGRRPPRACRCTKASPGRRGSSRSSSRSSARRLGPLAHRGRHLGLDHADAELGEVADHGLHVAADVADLGVLGGLHLEERRLGELGQAAGDLGLPDAGGPDHDDVLRRDLVAQLGGQVLPPPAVAQRDGHRALGLVLADDVAVELGDDLGRREAGASSVAERSGCRSQAQHRDLVVGVDADAGRDAHAPRSAMPRRSSVGVRDAARAPRRARRARPSRCRSGRRRARSRRRCPRR